LPEDEAWHRIIAVGAAGPAPQDAVSSKNRSRQRTVHGEGINGILRTGGHMTA